MNDRATKWRRQSNYRRDVMGSLARHGTSDNAAEAVPNQVNLFPGVAKRFFNVVFQSLLDEQIGTFRVQPDSRKVRPIADTAKPRMQLGEVCIRSQKARHQNNGGAVAAGNTEAVVDRRGVQQQKVGCEESFFPDSDVGFYVLPAERFGLAAGP